MLFLIFLFIFIFFFNNGDTYFKLLFNPNRLSQRGHSDESQSL